MFVWTLCIDDHAEKFDAFQTVVEMEHNTQAKNNIDQVRLVSDVRKQ